MCGRIANKECEGRDPQATRLDGKLSASLEAGDYSIGGVAAKFEQAVAAALGKETAVWFSTGTLASHLAVRPELPGPGDACLGFPCFFTQYWHSHENVHGQRK